MINHRSNSNISSITLRSPRPSTHHSSTRLPSSFFPSNLNNPISASPASINPHTSILTGRSTNTSGDRYLPDPLSSFRADASRLPFQAQPAINTMTSDDDMQGIEDITLSQWQACPPGRTSDGASSSSAGQAGGQKSDDDRTRWDGGEGSSTRKRKDWMASDDEDEIGDDVVIKRLPAKRKSQLSRTPSSSPVMIRKLLPASPASQSGYGQNMDDYDMDVVDDRSPAQSPSFRRPFAVRSSGVINLSDEVDDEGSVGGGDSRGDGRGDESESSGESTHMPTSQNTHHIGSDDDDDGNGEIDGWDASPPSPRSLARRKKNTTRFLSDSEDDKGGGPGPSTRQHRSTNRKAAVDARARARHFLVLSQDEDDDYHPGVGGDTHAFTREYEKQAEKERDEPEETDGSDESIDARDGEEDEGLDEHPTSAGDFDEGDEDFVVMGSHVPPPSSKAKAVAPTKKTPVYPLFNKSSDPSRTTPAETTKPVSKPTTKTSSAISGLSKKATQVQPPPKKSTTTVIVDDEDEFDNYGDDIFDNINIDELPGSNPSNKSNSGPSSNLNDLFSPPPAKRPASVVASSSSSRLPLRDLPHSSLQPSAPRSVIPKNSILRQLDGIADIQDIAQPNFGQPTRVEEEEQEPLGYMPVSQMPPKWRDFYLNHWRRGADKSKAMTAPAGAQDEEYDEAVDGDIPDRSGHRATAAKAAKAAKSARGGKGSRGGKAARPAVRRQEVDDEEDDYEGELGGPGPTTKSSSRSWPAKKSWRGGGARRGGGGGRRSYAKKR